MCYHYRPVLPNAEPVVVSLLTRSTYSFLFFEQPKQKKVGKLRNMTQTSYNLISAMYGIALATEIVTLILMTLVKSFSNIHWLGNDVAVNTTGNHYNRHQKLIKSKSSNCKLITKAKKDEQVSKEEIYELSLPKSEPFVNAHPVIEILKWVLEHAFKDDELKALNRLNTMSPAHREQIWKFIIYIGCKFGSVFVLSKNSIGNNFTMVSQTPKGIMVGLDIRGCKWPVPQEIEEKLQNDIISDDWSDQEKSNYEKFEKQGDEIWDQIIRTAKKNGIKHFYYLWYLCKDTRNLGLLSDNSHSDDHSGRSRLTIGQKLLKHCRAHAIKLRRKHIILDCNASFRNGKFVKYYEKNGFKVLNKVTLSFHNRDIEWAIMCLQTYGKNCVYKYHVNKIKNGRKAHNKARKRDLIPYGIYKSNGCANGRTVYQGPRGGLYTISKHDHKSYKHKSQCIKY